MWLFRGVLEPDSRTQPGAHSLRFSCAPETPLLQPGEEQRKQAHDEAHGEGAPTDVVGLVYSGELESCESGLGYQRTLEP